MGAAGIMLDMAVVEQGSMSEAEVEKQPERMWGDG